MSDFSSGVQHTEGLQHGSLVLPLLRKSEGVHAPGRFSQEPWSTDERT